MNVPSSSQAHLIRRRTTSMRNPWLVRFGRGLLVAAVVGWHGLSLWFRGEGTSPLGVVAHRGRALRPGSGVLAPGRHRISARTGCEAAGQVQSTASKLCSKCKSLLPVEEFAPHRRSADGHQPWCRNCAKQHSKMWRQKQKAANKDRGRPPDDEQVFCPACQRILPAADFSTDLMRINLLQSQCKACVKLGCLKFAALNEQRTMPPSFPAPSALELQEIVAIENARDRNEALSSYGMYFCPSCRRPKSYEAFYKAKRQKHGVTGFCKECLAVMRKITLLLVYAPCSNAHT